MMEAAKDRWLGDDLERVGFTPGELLSMIVREVSRNSDSRSAFPDTDVHLKGYGEVDRRFEHLKSWNEFFNLIKRDDLDALVLNRFGRHYDIDVSKLKEDEAMGARNNGDMVVLAVVISRSEDGKITILSPLTVIVAPSEEAAKNMMVVQLPPNITTNSEEMKKVEVLIRPF